MGLFSGVGKVFGGAGNIIGDYAEDLFGPGTSKGSPQRVNTFTPEQNALLKSLIQQTQTKGFGPAPTAPPMYTPQNEQETAYLNWAKSEAVKNMASGQVPYEVGPEYAQQYFEESIRPTYEREWRETILPQLQESYAGSTFSGGMRAQAEYRAARDYAEKLAGEKAKLTYGEEQAKRAAIENAQGRILPAGDVQKTAGEYQRAIDTEKVMDILSRYLMGEQVNGQYNMAYNPMMQLSLALLGLNPYSIGQETKSSGPGLISGLLGGASSGIGQGIGSYIMYA